MKVSTQTTLYATLETPSRISGDTPCNDVNATTDVGIEPHESTMDGFAVATSACDGALPLPAPKHPDVAWAMKWWQQWNSPHAIRARPAFDVLLHRAESERGNRLLSREQVGEAWKSGKQDFLALREQVTTYTRGLPFSLPPHFFETMQRELSAMRASVATAYEAIVGSVAAEDGGLQQRHRDCLSAIETRVDALVQRCFDLSTRRQLTYGDALDLIPEFAGLADEEAIAQLAASSGDHSRLPTDPAKVVTRGINFQNVRSTLRNEVMAGAPYLLAFPSFSSFEKGDFPAKPVWPIVLARGPQAFDGLKGALPGRATYHDLQHIRPYAEMKLKSRGGYALGGEALTPLTRGSAQVLARLGAREEQLRLFWENEIKLVPDPVLAEFLSTSLFVCVHEFVFRSPTRAGMIAAVDKIVESLDPARNAYFASPTQLVEGTSINATNVAERAARAKAWLMTVKISGPSTVA